MSPLVVYIEHNFPLKVHRQPLLLWNNFDEVALKK